MEHDQVAKADLQTREVLTVCAEVVRDCPLVVDQGEMDDELLKCRAAHGDAA